MEVEQGVKVGGEEGEVQKGAEEENQRQKVGGEEKT